MDKWSLSSGFFQQPRHTHFVSEAHIERKYNMDNSIIMWLGIFLGGLAGLAGGVFGTYVSIKNTNGPKERAFMVKCSVFAWTGIIVFLSLLFVVPMPYKLYLWIPYGLLLPFAVKHGNKRQAEIRQSERLA